MKVSLKYSSINQKRNARNHTELSSGKIIRWIHSTTGGMVEINDLIWTPNQAHQQDLSLLLKSINNNKIQVISTGDFNEHHSTKGLLKALQTTSVLISITKWQPKTLESCLKLFLADFVGRCDMFSLSFICYCVL
jgi:hypothetical protein